MGAYRIGRITHPWTNFTPPIRGGIYRKCQDEEESISSASDDEAPALTSRLASLNSSTTSLELELDDGLKSLHEPLIRTISKSTDCDGDGCDNGVDVSHRGAFQVEDGIFDPCSASKGLADYIVPHVQSPEAYTAQTVQAEINKDLDDYPSLDASTQRGITAKYQALHQRVKDEGFYDCRYAEYGKECVRYTILLTLFFIALRAGWYMTSAAFLGFFWVSDIHVRTLMDANIDQHQIMFVAHDAGHRGITHNFIADTLIGMFVADFCCGLSIGWWKSSHNVHHLVTNHPVSYGVNGLRADPHTNT